MRITGLRIDRFGVWSDLTMDNLADGMTVFYGPNEAGKSTLMQFIRTVLYGFEPNRCERFLAKPRESGVLLPDDRLPGGSLFVTSTDANYHVRRHADAADPLTNPGKVTVSTPEHGKQGPQQLATLLNGIDEAIYNNVFAVGLREVQRLASLDDTQAARQLYSLSTGTDRVSLVDVTRQLRSTKCRLVGCDDQPSLLSEYFEQQRQASTRIRHLATQSAKWAGLVRERDDLQAEIKRLESLLTKTNHRAEIAEAALRIQPKWETLRQLNVEIESMGVVPEIPGRIVDTIGRLKNEIAAHQQRYVGLQQRREQLQIDLQKLTLNDALHRHSARIHAMLEERTSIVALDARVDKLKNELEEAEFEVQAEQERLGLASVQGATGGNTTSVHLPKFDPATIAALQDPAYSLERDRQMLEAVKQEAAGYKAQVTKLGQEISRAMGHDPDWFSKQDADDVLRAMEQTTGAASGLRREMKVKQDIEELTEELQEIEDRRAGVLCSQLLPWDIVKALGALFALGSMLFLCGLLGEWLGVPEARRGTLLLMGVIGTGLAALLKFVLDVPVRDGLRDTQRQFELLQEQLDDAELEMEKLNESNAALPGADRGKRTGPISLRDTETRLVRLEGLLPLEHQRRGMLKLAEQAERRAIEIAKSMTETRHRWEQTLTGLGLSTKLTTDQIKALSADSNALIQLHRVVEERRVRYEEARSEQAILAERLRDLMADALIRPINDRPSDKLQQLATAMAEQDLLNKQQQSLKKQERELKREYQNVERTIQQLQRKRSSQITMAGAADEDDLQRLRNRRQKYMNLREQRKSLQAEIDAAMGDGRREKTLQRHLKSSNAQQLPDRLQRVQSDLEQTAARLKELQYRNGEITEQIRNLAGDQSLGRAHLQLGLIQHQTDEGIHKWKVVDAFGSLLSSVYKKYEKDRQPDTLKEASRYLKRMTSGRYQRIWTPLAEDVLIVEDQKGRQLPIEVLSRGTREQLFLSLRLALVAGYARRGVQMPVILDDVLVNFDSDRTESAAKVIVDFARSGHQVLVFTCHQHIKDIFANLQVDVRDIPRRSNAIDIDPNDIEDQIAASEVVTDPIVEFPNTIERMPTKLTEPATHLAAGLGRTHSAQLGLQDHVPNPTSIAADAEVNGAELPPTVVLGFDLPVAPANAKEISNEELLGNHQTASESFDNDADYEEMPRDYYRQWDNPPIRLEDRIVEIDQPHPLNVAPMDSEKENVEFDGRHPSVETEFVAARTPPSVSRPPVVSSLPPIISGSASADSAIRKSDYSDYAEPVVDDDLVINASVAMAASKRGEFAKSTMDSPGQVAPLGFSDSSLYPSANPVLVSGGFREDGTISSPVEAMEERHKKVANDSALGYDEPALTDDFRKGSLKSVNVEKNQPKNNKSEPPSSVKEPDEFDDVQDIDLQTPSTSKSPASDSMETTMTFDPTQEELMNDDVVASTASGDELLDDEYEYEYVDDEAAEGEEDEYEYVEVEVDEDGNEIVASDEDDEEFEDDSDEDEYEYVEVDDEDEEYEEVAAGEEDDEEDEDEEYEYVDAEEDELDEEYEYVEVDVDEDGNEIVAEDEDEYIESETEDSDEFEVEDDFDDMEDAA